MKRVVPLPHFGFKTSFRSQSLLLYSNDSLFFSDSRGSATEPESANYACIVYQFFHKNGVHSSEKITLDKSNLQVKSYAFVHF